MINPTSPDYNKTPARRPDPGYRPALISQPLVSIITPFYNVAPAQFAETAACVWRQSWQQWRWLICNDGSSDPASLDHLNRYRQADPRITVIDLPENRGVSAARNVALAATTTPYVMFLDGDDLVEPTALEKWLWMLHTRPRLSFVRGYSVRFGHQPHLWPKSFELGSEFLLKNHLEPTALLRRAVIDTVGGFDEQIRDGLEDWEFWLNCANHGLWGASVPEYLSWYRIRPRHTSRWPNLSQTKTLAFRAKFQARYPALYAQGIPPADLSPARHGGKFLMDEPGENRLQVEAWRKREHKRLLLWGSNGQPDGGSAELLSLLADAKKHYISLCLTDPVSLSTLAQLTELIPDVFVLPHFLPPLDYPRFLSYLARSRQCGIVIANTDPLATCLANFLSEAPTYLYTMAPTGRALGGCYPASKLPLLLTDRLLANPPRPAPDPQTVIRSLSGEALGGLTEGRHLVKALGFKLANTPAGRWLYVVRAVWRFLLIISVR